jgi:zinc-finger of a C2HC-type
MERKNLSKTGQMLLSNNSPLRYEENKNYKTGPNFLNKFRSRPPSDNELQQA